MTVITSKQFCNHQSCFDIHIGGFSFLMDSLHDKTKSLARQGEELNLLVQLERGP